MKIAILSDIHGNMEAFQNVLKDIERAQISQILCLGDCIGYGPEPHKVLNLISDRNISTVLGNHELAILNPDYISWFNPIVQASLKKTREMLNSSALDQISRFPLFIIQHGCRLVHGFPPDLPKMYLFQASYEKLIRTFKTLSEPICFLGHTHKLELIEYTGKTIIRKTLKKETVYLNENYRYIINIGSVGQPRDSDNNAKYVIWDETEKSIEICYVPYDIARTAQKIKAAGLPEMHAKRLWC
jgi:predicted phosphodiesterase